MLDDLKIIHQRDAQDCLGHAEKQWQQLTREFKLPTLFKTDNIQNIVFMGMGSPVTSSELARQWLDLTKPFEVTRAYDVPSYADETTLCIITSLDSGDRTILSSLEQAGMQGARVVIVTPGGELAEAARVKQESNPTQYVVWTLPELTGSGNLADAARPTYLLVFKMLTDILISCGLVKNKLNAADGLAVQADWLAAQSSAWRPDISSVSNLAKQIALELIGKSVVVYTGPLFSAVAHHWKVGINQYAKQIAWSGDYLEHSFNDIAGWSRQPVHKPYAVVELRSSLEHDYIQKSYSITDKLLSGLRPAPIIVQLVGNTLLQQLLYSTVLGDFVAMYLALLNGVNPAGSELINRFKKEIV